MAYRSDGKEFVLGIVGAEAAKFTPRSQVSARAVIRSYIAIFQATKVTSGHCHLGGVDIWAEEEAKELTVFDPALIFPPKTLRWSDGYKPRNIQIAQACDALVNIVVDRLPETYTGMRFEDCYHCIQANRVYDYEPHVKSGGCWSYWFAKEVYDKEVRRVVVRN